MAVQWRAPNYMNQLHLIDTTGSGGAETVFTEIVKHQSEHHKCVVVLRGPGWVKDTLVGTQAELLIYDFASASRFSFIFFLLRCLRNEQIELVHAHLLTASLYGSIAARICGVRVITTFHGPSDFNGERLVALKVAVIKFLSKKNAQRLGDRSVGGQVAHRHIATSDIWTKRHVCTLDVEPACGLDG